MFEKHTKGQPTVSEKEMKEEMFRKKRFFGKEKLFRKQKFIQKAYSGGYSGWGKDRKRRIVDEYGLDPDKTIVYRPRRTKDPEIDLPLDSYAYDDSCGRSSYSMNPGRKRPIPSG